MKLIILFLLFSFSAFGNYAKISEVESKSISTVWVKKSKCGSDCIKIPFGYNKNFHKVENEMVNNHDSPIQSKSEIESCVDQDDCESKNAIKVCADELETVYMDEFYSEIYCSKITGYDQKLSGRKIVVEDSGLKSAHIAAKQAERDAKAAKKAAIMLLKDKVNADQDLTPSEQRQVFKYLLK